MPRRGRTSRRRRRPVQRTPSTPTPRRVPDLTSSWMRSSSCSAPGPRCRPARPHRRSREPASRCPGRRAAPRWRTKRGLLGRSRAALVGERGAPIDQLVTPQPLGGRPERPDPPALRELLDLPAGPGGAASRCARIRVCARGSLAIVLRGQQHRRPPHPARIHLIRVRRGGGGAVRLPSVTGRVTLPPTQLLVYRFGRAPASRGGWSARWSGSRAEAGCASSTSSSSRGTPRPASWPRSACKATPAASLGRCSTSDSIRQDDAGRLSTRSPMRVMSRARRSRSSGKRWSRAPRWPRCSSTTSGPGSRGRGIAYRRGAARQRVRRRHGARRAGVRLAGRHGT